MKQPSIISRKEVSVFSTPTLKGTSAVVYQLGKATPSNQLQAIAGEEGAPATCFFYQLKANTYCVRCFNASQEIQLCGHGLLATAKIIARLGVKNFSLSTKSQVVKVACESESDRSDNQVWLIFDDTSIIASQPPSWSNKVFNELPDAVFTVGDSDGYFVMQWPDGFNLKSLTLNPTELTKHTDRALIATCKTTLPEYDYCFRYFAPQHGVVEDKATGSAHRVLVSYWNKRLNKCNVKALQLSNAGAEMIGRYDVGKVWISGAVSILE
ncbi:PhzF family phenazine biosynthesis protein [Kangiella japonica]|uniref:PhzF family phenazine biosynthesis protein n=1 Tax=Kangiella japonica TaxID=647384 RepID=A0ABN0ST42_9GAMM